MDYEEMERTICVKCRNYKDNPEMNYLEFPDDKKRCYIWHRCLNYYTYGTWAFPPK